MKLATVMGASFSKSLQVRRPMVVSMTAVGPVGTTGGFIWLVVLGASGSCCEEAVVDCVCACAEKTLQARTSARVRNVMRGLTPFDSNRQANADKTIGAMHGGRQGQRRPMPRYPSADRRFLMARQSTPHTQTQQNAGEIASELEPLRDEARENDDAG